MIRKLSFLAVVTALVACLAGVLNTGVARADLNLDGCPSATPYATLTLGQTPDSVTWWPDLYNLFCSRLVVDVSVAPSGGKQFEIDGSYAGPATGPSWAFDLNPLPLSQSDCNLYKEHVALYRKPWFTFSPPAKFTLVSSASYGGHWIYADNSDPTFPISAHCTLELKSGSPPPYPLYTGYAPFGGATYRMAISAQTSGVQKVRVHTDYVPAPPVIS
jgi:hypothetical protein